MKKYFVASLAFLFVGCASGPTLVGKWQVSGMKSLPPNSKMYMTFSAPDKMDMEMDMPLAGIPGAGKDAGINFHVLGTYKQEGSKITMKAEDVKYTTKGIPDSVKGMLESNMGTQKKSMMDQINKEGAQSIEWKGNDEFTMKSATGDMTATRMKG